MRKSSINRTWTICTVCGLALTLTGCATASHADAGALAGAGLGGTMGALIGSQNGHAGGGAALGAVAGAVVGGLAGQAEDVRDQRDAAIAQAQYERANAAARQAVSNYDLISMAQAGLSDKVIVNAVETRGGQFDLSPSAIIELKSHGVSDDVILSIQHSSQSSGSYRTAVSPQPMTVVTTAPPVYIVRPAPVPRVGVYFGPRPYGPYYRHRHYW